MRYNPSMVVLEFIILTLIITVAAYFLSHGAETMAEKYGANFVGSILLGLITTLPEYMFVIWACLKGQYGMAIGSAIGACSLLMTLGYGSVILLSTSRFSKHPVKAVELSKNTGIDALYLLGTALVALALAWEKNSFDIKDGIILNLLFVAYVIHLTLNALAFSKKGHKENKVIPKKDFQKAIVFLITGALIIFFVSEPFVDSMIELSHFIGISPVVVAIILGPLASEMPEKLTAYLTVLRDGRLAEISICNFIGSKINHNSLLFGLIPFMGLHNGLSAVGPIITVPFLYMTLVTVFGTFSLARRKLTKTQGVIFLLLYAVLIWVSYNY